MAATDDDAKTLEKWVDEAEAQEQNDVVNVSVVESLSDRLADLESTFDQEKLKSIDQQKLEAGLPTHVNTQEMSEMGVVVIMRKQKTTALLTETGQVSDGYLVLWRPLNLKRYYTTFIGGVVLCRELGYLALPVKTKLVKRGRTWTLKSV